MHMKKRIIFILGIGLSFLILPFLINTSSILRIFSLIIGIILITLSYIYKTKRNIILIMLLPLILLVTSYALDTFLLYEVKRIPIFAIEIKSSKEVKTYNSFFYRVYDCNKKLVIDYGYLKNYACSKSSLEEIDVNNILANTKDSYKKYKNKFIKVLGKISKISGNEVIELSSYTLGSNSLNGYVNFNLNNNLSIKTYENLSTYRIYDYISIIGRVAKMDNNTITLSDAILIPSDIYKTYTYELISGNNTLTNLNSEKNYYYYGLTSLNVMYNEDNIYELSYLLTDEKLSWDELKNNLEVKEVLDNEDNILYKKYEGDYFTLMECANEKRVVVNKNVKNLDNICKMEIE